MPIAAKMFGLLAILTGSKTNPTDPIRHLSTEENKVPGDEKASYTDLRSHFVNYINHFWTKRIIAIGKEMIEPSKVALWLTGICRPYLYEMPEEYKKYETLWRWLGIPATFKSTKIKAVAC
jgi:hypothetical protein